VSGPGDSPRIAVAICTNRPPASVRTALEGAAGQARALGARMLLVSSGVSEAEHAELAALAGELGAEAVRAPEPGLAVARNAALAAAGDAEVLVFCDDDAIPAADWLERLAARWREAPAEVGCIGGRVLPRWQVPPPAWVGRGLHPALSLLDLGEGTIELEPGRRDGYGANLSFRVAALRQIGEFDPGLGAWRGYPLFGEETDAQIRLAAAGWRVLYAGDAVVEHRVEADRLTLRGLARRRFWFGVSSPAAAASPAAGALLALRAAAGLAPAIARGDQPLAGERLARAAQNAGVALRPLARARLRRHGWPGRSGVR